MSGTSCAEHASRVAARVAERASQTRVAELLSDGTERELWVCATATGILLNSAAFSFSEIKAVGVAAAQVALFFPAAASDVLFRAATAGEAEELAEAIRTGAPRLRSYFVLDDGDVSHVLPRLPDASAGVLSPAASPASTSSSSSSGLHLVPKELQATPPPAGAARRELGVGGREAAAAAAAAGLWCPFHPAHPAGDGAASVQGLAVPTPVEAPALPLVPRLTGAGTGAGDRVTLSGRITLERTQHALLESAEGFEAQRLHEAALRDISHSLGVPAEWVKVKFASSTR
eukprot:Rhum_TRINITY_DN11776_c0_g1::Rhum_TRINITY_DN11776_c0_g1_i1::g.46779::m.46779